MKKFVILASLFVAASAVVSCEKETTPIDDANKIILIAKAAGADTRTTVEDNGDQTYNVKWTRGDKVKVVYYDDNKDNPTGYGNAGFYNATTDHSTSVQVDAEDLTIGALDLTSSGTKKYALILYPYAANSNINSGLGAHHQTDQGHMVIGKMPADQNYVEKGPDALASLMVADVTFATDTKTELQYCTFDHIVSYGKLNIKNLPAGTLTKVVFRVNDSNAVLAGEEFKYLFKELKMVASSTAFSVVAKGSCITKPKNYVSVTGADMDASEVWIAVVPSYGESYTSVTVEATVNGTVYTKDFTSSIAFNRGKVRPINVDMTGATAK